MTPGRLALLRDMAADGHVAPFHHAEALNEVEKLEKELAAEKAKVTKLREVLAFIELEVSNNEREGLLADIALECRRALAEAVAP